MINCTLAFVSQYLISFIATGVERIKYLRSFWCVNLRTLISAIMIFEISHCFLRNVYSAKICMWFPTVDQFAGNNIFPAFGVANSLSRHFFSDILKMHQLSLTEYVCHIMLEMSSLPNVFFIILILMLCKFDLSNNYSLPLRLMIYFWMFFHVVKMSTKRNRFIHLELGITSFGGKFDRLKVQI